MCWHVVMLVLCCVNAVVSTTVPRQIHLGFAGRSPTGNPTGYTISWFTLSKTSRSVVQYGTNTSLGSSMDGVAVQYLRDFGYHHTARVVGLTPDVRYYYRVGDGTTWSEQFEFTSPSNSATKSFSFSVFGDMGYLGSEQRPMYVTVDGLVKNWTAIPTRQQLEKLKDDKAVNFFWHVGDVGYIDDAFAHAPAGFTYEKIYNEYQQWLQNLSSVMPYQVSVGNHESECHSPDCILDPELSRQLQNFTAYNARWSMDPEPSNGVLNMWYSWNYGPVHFVSANAETDFPGAGEENKGDSGLLPAGHFGRDGEYLEWLEAELKAANEPAARALRPFVIVGAHRPFGEIKGNGVEAMFAKYNVDLYLCGHAHNYARTLWNGTSDINIQKHHHTNNNNNGDEGRGGIFSQYRKKPGTWMEVIVGGAGSDETTYIASPGRARFGSHPRITGEDAVTFNQMATGVLDVNTTHLSWRLIESVGGKILDRFVLTH